MVIFLAAVTVSIGFNFGGSGGTIVVDLYMDGVLLKNVLNISSSGTTTGPFIDQKFFASVNVSHATHSFFFRTTTTYPAIVGVPSSAITISQADFAILEPRNP
jgi:hypothetical protein